MKKGYNIILSFVITLSIVGIFGLLFKLMDYIHYKYGLQILAWIQMLAIVTLVFVSVYFYLDDYL